MQAIIDLTGPQAPILPTRTTRVRQRVVAQCANPVGPVRRRTPQKTPCSIRRPNGYGIDGTHTNTNDSLPANITACEGRNDKVHIACSIATVTCDTMDDARCFVLHCGAAPLDQRGEHELFSKLFNIASRNGDGNELPVRCLPMSCGAKVFQAPWFTGKIRFRRVKRNDGKIAVFVTANLLLNVNRALNHRRAELGNGGYKSILKSASPVALGLDGKDNLAPFDLEQGEHDKARKRVLELTMKAILADVKRAAEAAEEAGSEGVAVSDHPSDFSLREVENCWDIGGADFNALQTLADITPALLEYGGKRGWEGNAGTVTVQFSKWERLVVYAKAPDRLRLEIRHRPPDGNRPYSSATLAETAGKLDELRKSAAVRINEVLSFVGSRPTAFRDVWEWEAYAMAWGACCGHTEAAKALYGILRQRGRIEGGKCVECIPGGDKLLRKARDAGLVSNTHGAFRPVFPNTPEPALTDFDNSALFAGHNTETQPARQVPKSPTPIRNGRESKGIPPSPPAGFGRSCIRLIINDL